MGQEIQRIRQNIVRSLFKTNFKEKGVKYGVLFLVLVPSVGP